MLRDQIAAQLGTSVMAGAVADGVSYDWWTEFSAQAGGLGTTFTPSIIGFGSTLDALSRVLDARSPPASLLWLLVAYLALWTFLSGGILDRYARQRRTYAHGFFAAAGRLFFRLARLAAAAGLVYWLLFRFVHPWLFLDLYRDLTRGLGVERDVAAVAPAVLRALRRGAARRQSRRRLRAHPPGGGGSPQRRSARCWRRCVSCGGIRSPSPASTR